MTDLPIDLFDKILLEQRKEKLSEYINHLIKNDFEKLISLLYRIDINEKKLKTILQTHANKNAGDIIAELIIERQNEKIESRKKNTPPITEENDFEKW